MRNGPDDLSIVRPVSYLVAPCYGAGKTTTRTWRVTPSDVTRMVTGFPVGVPATPVTSPLPLTVAIAVLSLLHVIVRPVSTLSFAARSCAVSWTVPPAFTFAGSGVTTMSATGRRTTVTEIVSARPSADRMTRVVPT